MASVMPLDNWLLRRPAQLRSHRRRPLPATLAAPRQPVAANPHPPLSAPAASRLQEAHTQADPPAWQLLRGSAAGSRDSTPPPAAVVPVAAPASAGQDGRQRQVQGEAVIGGVGAEVFSKCATQVAGQ